MELLVIESCLQGEIQAYLNAEKPVPEAGDTPVERAAGTSISTRRNKRNGTTTKTVKTPLGPMEVKVPRDRVGSFEPILLPKHSRTFGKIDEQILTMYARGMTTRDIEAFVRELYGVEISADYVSTVTDRVLKNIDEWQNRPLASVYPVAFFDALRVKIRSGATIKSMAVHLGIGIRADGTREVLGMWIGENEGASFWAGVFNGLKARGVEDMLIVVTDGLKGMTEAIETAFLEVMHQTCIVHLIRAATACVPAKDRKVVCDALKSIYQAVDAEQAEKALEAFEASALGKKYPSAAKVWRRSWGQVVPFFNFAPAIRTLIYTTNIIEGLNRAVRKVIKNRTVFLHEDAARKLIYLVIVNFTSGWKRPSMKWSAAMPEFALLFGDRFLRALE